MSNLNGTELHETKSNLNRLPTETVGDGDQEASVAISMSTYSDVTPVRPLTLDHDNLRESNNSPATPLLIKTTTPTSAITTATTTPTRTTSGQSQRPTTPTPAKKIISKRPLNLSLKIVRPTSHATSPKYAETENTALSTVTTTTTTSITPSSSSSNQSTNPQSTATLANTGNIFPHEECRNLKKLDIAFQNVTFSVKTGFFRKGTKNILQGITGFFRAGELSAIVGPSGAGKSTLLNILSAYTAFGYTGDITVNGNLRDIKAFKPNSAFITQDTSLQPFLTVKEAMHFAANLKIGIHMTTDEKRERVRKILEAIGMYENRHTRTGNLSGGQRKRLAIALELVNNPPVLILDEPTSGLDSSTSNQCVSLLKKLAMEGRTVICTIHQASALSFKMFDHIYAIAEGKCIYSGGSANLVPFLSEVGLDCPESYNPADFLMEISTDDYGKQNHKLAEKTCNGRNESYRQGSAAREVQMEAIRKVDKMMASGLLTPVTAPVLTSPAKEYPSHNVYTKNQKPQRHQPLTPINEMSSRIWDNEGIESGVAESKDKQDQTSNRVGCCKSKKPKLHLEAPNLCKRENIYATSFFRQLGILLVRTFLIMWRDKSITTLRFVIHFVTALLIGFLYYGIGNDAGNALNNFRYAFYTLMFIMYCAFSAILVKFPLEFPIVLREHFNRWYSLRAYYVALTLADVPIQLICTSLFIIITYVLTDQPLEFVRLVLFSFMVFLTALVAQSIGLTVGASLSVQLGAILGPFFICPFFVFSGFFLQYKDAPSYLGWLFHVSFLRYSLDGVMLALFGYNRPKMPCSDIYCHYSRPKTFLKDLDMENASYQIAVIYLISAFLGLRILAFYIMSFRLRLFRL